MKKHIALLAASAALILTGCVIVADPDAITVHQYEPAPSASPTPTPKATPTPAPTPKPPPLKPSERPRLMLPKA